MSEFRVTVETASDLKSGRRIRIVTWSAIPLFLGICVLAFYGVYSSSHLLNTVLTWLAVVAVGAAILGAYLLAAHLGLGKLQREMVFVLTDQDLIRKRIGWPELRVGLSEIKSVHERDGWLVVESTEPHHRIAIPERVDGFASLRAELTKHCPVTVERSSNKVGFLSTIASLICWAGVLFATDPTVVRIAAVAAVILLGWESTRLYVGARERRTRRVVLAWLSIGWVVALLLPYFRVFRRL